MDERNMETVNFEGYEIVGKEMFARNNIWISFNPGRKDHHIFIPKGCVKHLGNPPYVQMLVNPGGKQLLLRPLWRKKEGKGWHGIRTSITLITGSEGSIIKSCEPLFRKIAEIAGWEGNPDAKHRIHGRAAETDGGRPILLFSLDETDLFIPTETVFSASPVSDEGDKR